MLRPGSISTGLAHALGWNVLSTPTQEVVHGHFLDAVRRCVGIEESTRPNRRGRGTAERKSCRRPTV
jgi:hypothetical protein